MELNQKMSNFSDLTCLFNNGWSLVTSGHVHKYEAVFGYFVDI